MVAKTLNGGDEGDFSVFTFQPMLYYDIPSIPGATIHFNNSITADWRVKVGLTWLIPRKASTPRTRGIAEGPRHLFGVGGLLCHSTFKRP